MKLTVTMPEVHWIFPDWVRPIRSRGKGGARSTTEERAEWIRTNVVHGAPVDVYELVERMRVAGLFAKSTYRKDVASGVRHICRAQGHAVI